MRLRGLGFALVAGIDVVALVACGGSIQPEYQKARDEALAAPPPVPADWKPDVVLQMSHDNLADVVSAALDQYGELKGRYQQSVLGITAVATPDLTVDKIDFGASKKCDGCLAVDLTLSGNVGWELGGRRGTVPVKARAKFDAALEATQVEQSWQVTATPKDVRDVDVDVGNTGADVGQLLNEGLADWARKNLTKDVPPIDLGTYGDPGVPLRAVALRPANDGLRIDMLTRSPSPTPIDPPVADLKKGFRLFVSQDSLLDLSRAASFQAGPVSHDVVVDPTSMAFDGDQFTLGMRFWMISGKGWWRDYTVTGTMNVKPKGIKLDAKDVQEGDKSKGAALVDPIAALGEGYILKAIEDTVSTTLPATRTEKAGHLRTDVTVSGVKGQGDMLVVDGAMVVKGLKDAGPGGRPH